MRACCYVNIGDFVGSVFERGAKGARDAALNAAESQGIIGFAMPPSTLFSFSWDWRSVDFPYLPIDIVHSHLSLTVRLPENSLATEVTATAS